jgi:hypothetical protein
LNLVTVPVAVDAFVRAVEKRNRESRTRAAGQAVVQREVEGLDGEMERLPEGCLVFPNVVPDEPFVGAKVAIGEADLPLSPFEVIVSRRAQTGRDETDGRSALREC